MTQPEIDAFNDRLRQSPEYRQFLTSIGIDLARPVELSDEQRKQAAQWLASQGIQLPNGLEIDPAGNINQNEGFGKQLKRWGPVAAGAAITAFGIPGVMPGLVGGGSAAAGSAAAGATSTAAKAIGAITPTSQIVRDVIGQLGAGASGYASAAAANRGTQADVDLANAAIRQQAERDFHDQSIRREQAGREKANNAWDQMNRASCDF